MPLQLDDYDVSILKSLLKDGRKSFREISRDTGITSPTVKARFERLVNVSFPITVHLMGKEHVLGLIIDPVTTDRHFVSDHEMFGTLIKGTGLEKIEKTLPPQKNGKGMNMNGMAM